MNKKIFGVLFVLSIFGSHAHAMDTRDRPVFLPSYDDKWSGCTRVERQCHKDLNTCKETCREWCAEGGEKGQTRSKTYDIKGCKKNMQY